MKSYQGQTAFITGGASGIGLGLATALGQRGARVVLASTNAEKIAHAVHSLNAQRIEALGIALDVADPDAWPNALQSAEQSFGPIGFLALNAGVAPPPATIAATTMAVWNWSLGVNLWGVIHGLHFGLPRLLAAGRPAHILMTSSIAALTPSPTMGAYVAAKAGVVALAEVLRQELAGTPVRCSVMTPAAVRTEIVASSKSHTPTGDDAGYSAIAAHLANGLDPLRVAQHALERIDGGDFYILSHDDHRQPISDKFAELKAAMDHGA